MVKIRFVAKTQILYNFDNSEVKDIIKNKAERYVSD
jgi:hypothetical protein